MVILLGIMEDAIAGKITDEMRKVAEDEGKTPEYICRGIASGKIVIPVSPYRHTRPVGIGKGLSTKVNASIGTSSDIVNVDMEVEKARVAEISGADTLMELSTGGDFTHIAEEVSRLPALALEASLCTRPS